MFKQVIGSALIAGAMAGGLALSAPAQATTLFEVEKEFCTLLDDYPVNLVMPMIAVELDKRGITAEGAIIINAAVHDVCPRHAAAVRNWARS